MECEGGGARRQPLSRSRLRAGSACAGASTMATPTGTTTVFASANEMRVNHAESNDTYLRSVGHHVGGLGGSLRHANFISVERHGRESAGGPWRLSSLSYRRLTAADVPMIFEVVGMCPGITTLKYVGPLAPY